MGGHITNCYFKSLSGWDRVVPEIKSPCPANCWKGLRFSRFLTGSLNRCEYSHRTFPSKSTSLSRLVRFRRPIGRYHDSALSVLACRQGIVRDGGRLECNLGGAVEPATSYATASIRVLQGGPGDRFLSILGPPML